MTDNWNTIEGQTPHDRAMTYNTLPTDDVIEDSFAKLYDRGLAILKQARFSLERSPVGAHCGHNAYIRTTPRDIKGITCPDWFKVLRLLETPEDEAELTNTLLRSEAATAEIQQFWSPLTQPLSGQRATPLQGYVERLQRIDQNARKQNESLPYELGIQVSGFTKATAANEPPPRAYIPPREWFKDSVQQLKFCDIFTLWPDAELEMLKLILGRAWLGRSNAKLIGEPSIVQHTFRSVGIVIGEDAGLGKSTIFDKLSKATNATGYRWSNFRNISEQFGLGDIVESDISYKDDVTGATLKALISSENTKIIASGGQIFVEDKFQKGTSVRSKCVLLANTNEWNPRLVYSLDSGTVDRIKLLSTYRRAELNTEAKKRASDVAKNSPNFAPFVHLPWLANELDVSEECLMLWACRLAVDAFNELTFRQGDVPNESLRKRIHDVSSRLRYAFNKDCTRSLISAMIMSHIIVSHLPDRVLGIQPYEMLEINPAVLGTVFDNFRCLVTDRGMYRLRELIKYHWELNNRPDTHPWSCIRKLNMLSVMEANKKFSNAVSAKATLDEQVESLFGAIRLRDGFTGSKDIIWVTSAWQACQGYVENIESLARTVDKIMVGNPAVFKNSMIGISRAVRGIADDEWLTNCDYTPALVDKLLSEESNDFDIKQYKDILQTAEWQF